MKKFGMILGIVIILGVMAVTLHAYGEASMKRLVVTENHWQVALNNKFYRGKMEVRVPTGVIDIATETDVVEVDKLSNFALGIEQALRYAKATGKKPVLAVYIDGDKGALSLLKEAETACNAQGVTLVLVNSHVDVVDVMMLALESSESRAKSAGSEAKPAVQVPDTVAAKPEADSGKDYWITQSSSVRHNKTCRY